MCYLCDNAKKLFRNEEGKCRLCDFFFTNRSVQISADNQAFLSQNFYKVLQEPFCSMLQKYSLDLTGPRLTVFSLVEADGQIGKAVSDCQAPPPKQPFSTGPL